MSNELEGEATVVIGRGVDRVLREAVAGGDDGDSAFETEGEELAIDPKLVTVPEAAAVNVVEEWARSCAGSLEEVEDVSRVGGRRRCRLCQV